MQIVFLVDNLIVHQIQMIVVPTPVGRGHIDFGLDPVDVNIGIYFSMTLSCLRTILLNSGWIRTKLSWIYNWDITKNWLDIGDLDLIFKVTVIETLKSHGRGTSVFS